MADDAKAAPAKSGLRACRHCGHLCAPSAPTCPACGGKSPGLSIRELVAGGILTFVFLFACCVIPFSSKKDPPAEKPASPAPAPVTAPSSPPTDWGKAHAWTMAKQFVTDRLKSPSTANFGGFFSGDYQSSDDCVKKVGPDTYVATGWVDSQNGFGATVRTNFIVKLRDDKNGKWTLLGDPVFLSR